MNDDTILKELDKCLRAELRRKYISAYNRDTRLLKQMAKGHREFSGLHHLITTGHASSDRHVER